MSYFCHPQQSYTVFPEWDSTGSTVGVGKETDS